MHELTLVQGILDAVQETASGKRAKVLSFEVRVGELAQFVLGTVRALLKELRRGTPLERARVVVRSEKTSVKCLSCGTILGFRDVVRGLSRDEREVVHFFPELLNSYSRCPSCSKSFMEIERGRSVRIALVKLDA